MVTSPALMVTPVPCQRPSIIEVEFLLLEITDELPAIMKAPFMVTVVPLRELNWNSR